eukprot:gene2623-3403_t
MSELSTSASKNVLALAAKKNIRKSASNASAKLTKQPSFNTSAPLMSPTMPPGKILLPPLLVQKTAPSSLGGAGLLKNLAPVITTTTGIATQLHEKYLSRLVPGSTEVEPSFHQLIIGLSANSDDETVQLARSE